MTMKHVGYTVLCVVGRKVWLDGSASFYKNRREAVQRQQRDREYGYRSRIAKIYVKKNDLVKAAPNPKNG